MARRAKPNYNADREPTQAFWEHLSEEEQTAAIMRHHRLRGFPTPNPQLHATSHLLVEQQLASGEVPEAEATLDRLLAEGLDRHDAVHAIASVLTRLMAELVDGSWPEDFALVYEKELALLPDSWYAIFDDEP